MTAIELPSPSADQLPLYREAALVSNRAPWHGEVIVSSPLTARFVSLLCLVVVGSIVLYFTFGSYTERVTVRGQVTPEAGVVGVYVQQPGTIVQEQIAEGQQVQKGDVLFVVSNERSSADGDVQARISAQVQQQMDAMLRQRDSENRLFQSEYDAIIAKIRTMSDALPKAQAMISSQQERVALGEQMLSRYRQLHEEGHLTYDQFTSGQAQLLDLRGRLLSLEREEITLRGNLQDLEAQRESYPVRHEKQLAELEWRLASIEQLYAESESKREHIVVATEAGTVTAVTVHEGQRADLNGPVASIVPQDATLRVELYAHSRAIGFVKPGDPVFVRYQAYPYQKFGQHQGKVSSIATTALSSLELTRTNAFSSGNVPGGEPLYRIIVDLESQEMQGANETFPLRAGMLLDADIMQEERKLYEWILDPLYRIGRRN